uniref:BAALC binder of MAP3K1 and KLF4 b n=1 Tax=Acanthochromis polyacanthus TaxID=80966 RepID=A0A3Q1GFP0_9TELE
MGCGGSRADAIIEPRYHESWTRETESTWLTNTDVETPLPVAASKNLHPSFCLLQLENETSVIAGKALESSLREKRMVNTGTQCGKQALTTTSSNHQRRPRRSLSDVGVTGSRYWHVQLLNIQTPTACLCSRGAASHTVPVLSSYITPHLHGLKSQSSAELGSIS